MFLSPAPGQTAQSSMILEGVTKCGKINLVQPGHLATTHRTKNDGPSVLYYDTRSGGVARLAHPGMGDQFESGRCDQLIVVAPLAHHQGHSYSTTNTPR